MITKELLDNAILSCIKLQNIFYLIKIGKNNKTIDIRLSFKQASFFHLLGLHKLKDVNEFNKNNTNKERLIGEVCKNNNDICKRILNSRYISAIIPRLKALTKLEYILDNNLEVYYNKNNYYSLMNQIDYDIVFHFNNNDSIFSFYFIKQTSEDYVMVSLLERTIPKGQHANRPFALLKKTKYESNIQIIIK